MPGVGGGFGAGGPQAAYGRLEVALRINEELGGRDHARARLEPREYLDIAVGFEAQADRTRLFIDGAMPS